MTEKIEFAGTLFPNERSADKAGIEEFLQDGEFTEGNFQIPSGDIADEILEGWSLPFFDGTRQELIMLIDEVKQERKTE